MSSYDVRKAKLTDIDPLVVLFEEYRIFYKKNPDPIKTKNFLSERMKNNESVIFICNSGNEMLAFSQLYPIFSSTRLKRLWLLNDLYVAKDARGKGLSKLLIERRKELCHETDACGLILETGKTNDVGNNLYPSVGFTLDTLYNHYYWDR